MKAKYPRFWTAGVLGLMLVASGSLRAGSHLGPDNAGNTSLPPLAPAVDAAWGAYVAAAERRIAEELGARDRFLALDFAANAAASRRTVMSGGMIIEPVTATDSRGGRLQVPGSMTHHWRGAVLIPGATLDGVMNALRDGGVLGSSQEDVLQAKVLERAGDTMRVYLKLRRTKFVTAVFNTEHAVAFRRHGAGRSSSTSTAIKIAELRDPMTASEREVAAGDDRGFLWRWQAWWRYEQVAGGVIAECESISLSRDIPAVVRYMVRPLVERTARESMERTLLTLKAI